MSGIKSNEDYKKRNKKQFKKQSTMNEGEQIQKLKIKNLQEEN